MPETKKQTPKTILKFPPGFLWGAASSAYQVEGGITNNDWATASRFVPAGLTCDHYHRYKKDFQLARLLNQNAHRFSLEWSRLEPEEGQWDEDAADHYFYVLKFLKDHGLTTFLTLHHFTNPLWIMRQGGWTSQKTLDSFLDYVSRVVESLGQYVDFWVTVNEPNVYASMSYARGIWPPFQKNFWRAHQVYKNMLEAHNKAYDLIRAYYPQAKVGYSLNIAFNEPYNKTSFFDRFATQFADWLSIDLPLKRTRFDFIGLNHYFHNLVRFNVRQTVELRQKDKNLSDKGWEIYPRAIFEVLLKLKKFKKPIYVTENGIADRQDKKREEFIRRYLREIHRAILRSVPVKGYFYWSLLDNYEWPVKAGETGYESKFGLIEVDFKTQARRIRPSAKIYARICKQNAL